GNRIQRRIARRDNPYEFRRLQAGRGSENHAICAALSVGQPAAGRVTQNWGYRLTKIISGGQSGADTGALLGASELQIDKGGFAPRGWLTEDGPQEEILRGFGLIECDEEGYPPRTRANVIHSDGTLLVGNDRSGGSRLTHNLATELKKPLFQVPFGVDETKSSTASLEAFQSWLRRNHINVLNVAGNRESENP